MNVEWRTSLAAARRFAFSATLALFASGCGGGRVPRPAPTRVASIAAPDEAAALPAEVDGGAAIAPSDVVAEEVATDETPDAPAEPDAVVWPVEKFVVLALAGPIRLDLAVTIDGRPWRALRDDAAQALLASIAGTTEPPRWIDALADPRFDFGGTTYGELRNPWDRRRAAGLLDLRRDGVVDAPELAYYWESIAALGHALTFERPADRAADPAEGRIWRALDRDGDGRLDETEIDRAPTSLRALDINQDDGLAGDELDATVASRAMGMPDDSRRDEGPTIAFWLTDALRWDSLRRAWEEAYDRRGDDEAPLAAAKRAQLDASGDGRLTTAEWRRLAELESDLVWPIALGDVEGVTMPPRRWRDTDGQEQAQPAAPGSHAWSLDLGGARWELAALDAPSAAVASDLSPLDQDRDGAISASESEAAAAAQRNGLLRADADRDGQVDAEELATYGRWMSDVARGRLTVRVDSPRDPWLAALDADGDDRLSTREIEAASAKCHALARAHQREHARPEDAGGAIRLRVAAGGADIGARPARAPEDAAPPRWFVAMDVNGDGDVSRGEFLGGADPFAALDRDEDGLISASEAAMASPGATSEAGR